MKQILFFLFYATALIAPAQAPLTTSFTVSGSVEKTITITFPDIQQHPAVMLGDLAIYNHNGQQVSTAKQAKGVLLKDILKNFSITSPSDRDLSAYYLLCTASDGYAVTFSWNEVFNGSDLYILVEVDGVTLEQYSKSIQMWDTRDIQSGRRFMRGLTAIEIKKG